MTAREAILSRIKAARKILPGETSDAASVKMRLSTRPCGIVPARAQVQGVEALEQFCNMALAASASFEQVEAAELVPSRVADYLQRNNLPLKLRMGSDPRLKTMQWMDAAAFKNDFGHAEEADCVGLSFAFAGIAESGTVILHSGSDNPTTINFLPEHHIVVMQSSDIVGGLEDGFELLIRHFGAESFPRSINMITGPSRSADIEQTLLLGAHGPRSLHLIIIDN